MNNKKMTWNNLVAMEPRLQRLLNEVRGADPGICWDRRWYGSGSEDGFKHRLERLAGWTAERRAPELGTSEAYDLAYQYLIGQLPRCNPGCECYGILMAMSEDGELIF